MKQQRTMNLCLTRIAYLSLAGVALVLTLAMQLP